MNVLNHQFRHWAGLGSHGESNPGDVILNPDAVDQTEVYQALADFRVNHRLQRLVDALLFCCQLLKNEAHQSLMQQLFQCVGCAINIFIHGIRLKFDDAIAIQYRNGRIVFVITGFHFFVLDA